MEDGIEKHSVSFVMLLCVYYCPFMLHHLKHKKGYTESLYLANLGTSKSKLFGTSFKRYCLNGHTSPPINVLTK